MKKNNKTKSKKENKNNKAKRSSKKKTFQCPDCGYKHVHLHGGKCPMCKQCPRCKQKLHSCKCIEGE